MARPKSKAPSLRYHLSGQSVVTIDGRDFYLGRHNSPESLARYAVLIGIYQAGGLTLPEGFDLSALDDRVAVLTSLSPVAASTHQEAEPIRVRHVTAAYRLVAATKYASNAQELARIDKLTAELDTEAGDLLTTEYGPMKLQQQRQRWIDAGLSRLYCNRLTNLVIRMFRHAVSQELTAVAVVERLRSVEPLRAGQTTAVELEPVRPVAIGDVRATAAYLSPVLRAMIRVHLGTGMRPSEVCRMRPCDIDRTGNDWIYRPAKHKSAHRGAVKAVPIVGDARAAIEDYFNRPADAFLFSPAESMSWFRAQQRAARKSKVQPSQADRSKAKPERQPGGCFTPTSYRQAIQRAAKRAGVASWHPYQIRHLVASAIRDALGVEAAQAALGHAHLSMTQHYAKLSLDKAVQAVAAAPRL